MGWCVDNEDEVVMLKYESAMREKIFSKKFKHIITDALILLGIGTVVLVLAAVFEVTIAA